MKKIGSILFKVCIGLFVSLMLTACGDNPEFAGINEEEWNAMISPEVFTNYTLEYSGTVTQTKNDGEIYISDQNHIVKITENKCYLYGTAKFEGDEETSVFEKIYDDEDFLRIKANY